MKIAVSVHAIEMGVGRRRIIAFHLLALVHLQEEFKKKTQYKVSIREHGQYVANGFM